jgi:hypothetical protein
MNRDDIIKYVLSVIDKNENVKLSFYYEYKRKLFIGFEKDEYPLSYNLELFQLIQEKFNLDKSSDILNYDILIMPHNWIPKKVIRHFKLNKIVGKL